MASLANRVSVRLGTILSTIDDRETVVSSVDRVFRHPQYDSYYTVNDVGLLRLSQPVDFTDVIRPICLPSSDVDTDAFHVCVSTGFGRTSYGGISVSIVTVQL